MLKRVVRGVVICMALTSATVAVAQDKYRYITREQWALFEGPFSEMIEPFKILDNLYYVGSQNMGIYLFTSKQGDILLDSGMPKMAPGILANIQKLGFQTKDIKILLISHAHVDHVGGLAEIQKATGAKVMVMGADAKAVETGVDMSPIEFLGWTSVHVDRVLKDGDTVTLGQWTLHAISTPGHTPGMTAWATDVRDGVRTYHILFGGAAGPNAGPLVVGNPKFPDLAEQTLSTFAKFRALGPPDIQLTGHPQMILAGKIDAIKAGARPHPLLVDPAPYMKSIDDQEATFRKRVEADKAKLADNSGQGK